MAVTRRASIGRVLALLLTAGVLWLAPVGRFAAEPDCTPRPAARIPPGTQIGDGAPEGWTALVFKTQPRLDSGDIDQLGKSAVPLASLFFTAMTARVGREPAGGGRPYRLDEVAVGLGTRVGDRDLIVSSGKQAQLGARLDLLQQAILVVSEHELDRIEQVACSETMALVDLPTVMLRRGQHARAVLRYAVLVDPRDGRLASIVWRIDVGADGSYELADGPAVRTPPNLHQTCLLHVDGKQLILGIPTPMAFATPAMPSGQPVELPPALREIAGRKLLTAEMVRRIEAGLRGAIGFGSS